MDLGIACVRRVAALGSRDESNSLGIVVCRCSLGRLPFRKDDLQITLEKSENKTPVFKASRSFLIQNDAEQSYQRSSVDIEIWIHTRGALFASSQGKSHVSVVTHTVCCKRLENGVGNLRLGVDVLESQSFR